MFPPVASVTVDMDPLISILMLETTKLTEYMVEPLGRLVSPMVWEMFWSFRRSTVADPPFGTIVTVFDVTSPF